MRPGRQTQSRKGGRGGGRGGGVVVKTRNIRLSDHILACFYLLMSDRQINT